MSNTRETSFRVACRSQNSDELRSKFIILASAGEPRKSSAPLPAQTPQSVDKRCRRSHGRVERLAMDGPLVSRYLTLRRMLHCAALYCMLTAFCSGKYATRFTF